MPSLSLDIFDSIKASYAEHEAIRERIRERRDLADAAIRAVQLALAGLHGAANVCVAAAAARAQLLKTGAPIAHVEAALPDTSVPYAKYADMWCAQRSSVCTLAVFVEFVERARLAGPDDVRAMLGADVKLQLEDYLVGVCNAVTDMVRFCVNRVIVRDYDMPRRCARFAALVFDAFKELNFRNDFLRKRYDGLKYDVKRLEEIVYDLSVRGLLAGPAPELEDAEMKKEDVVANAEQTAAPAAAAEAHDDRMDADADAPKTGE